MSKPRPKKRSVSGLIGELGQSKNAIPGDCGGFGHDELGHDELGVMCCVRILKLMNSPAGLYTNVQVSH